MRKLMAERLAKRAAVRAMERVRIAREAVIAVASLVPDEEVMTRTEKLLADIACLDLKICREAGI